MKWLVWTLVTVLTWGVYGVFLHKGQMLMGDPANGRFKAFLFVGVAYLLAAVIGSAIILQANGATWSFTQSGVIWSTVAGLAGAIGALGVLLAFAEKGTPPVVMSIVFAGAPIINALTAIALHPPKAGWAAIKPQFLLGIALAALGGFLVTKFKPN
jgi:hypothetical protein